MESLPVDVEGPSDARRIVAAENAGATRPPVRFGVPDPVGLPLPPVLLNVGGGWSRGVQVQASPRSSPPPRAPCHGAPQADVPA
jgi:hypothetical protein